MVRSFTLSLKDLIPLDKTQIKLKQDKFGIDLVMVRKYIKHWNREVERIEKALVEKLALLPKRNMHVKQYPRGARALGPNGLPLPALKDASSEEQIKAKLEINDEPMGD